jgi:hypothetical protein
LRARRARGKIRTVAGSRPRGSEVVTSVWPDVAAATTPKAKIRDQLDYLVWMAEAMEAAGSHDGLQLESWRGRVQRAYTALVDSMTPGHGDSFPPDVPPTLRPGTWPDIAAAGIPGMTIRHQLAVIRTIAANTRADGHFPRAPADVSTWTARVQTAYDALDHGSSPVMPAEARSTPPAAPPKRPSKRKHAADKPARASKSKRAPAKRVKKGASKK